MSHTEMSTAPTIVLGADHAGYKLKEAIKNYLIGQKFPVEDVGTWTDESVDYPDYARKVGERVAGSDKVGVLVCGTAIGMTIAANKVDRGLALRKSTICSQREWRGSIPAQTCSHWERE